MQMVDSHTHVGLYCPRGEWHGDFELPNLERGVEGVQTQLWDLVFSPYGRWMAQQFGADFGSRAREAGFADDLAAAHEAPELLAGWWHEAWPRLATLGYFVCLDLGLRELLGFSLAEVRADTWAALNGDVEGAYAGGFFARVESVYSRLGCSLGIQPIQAAWHLAEPPPHRALGEQAERRLFRTVLRVDPFILGTAEPNYGRNRARLGDAYPDALRAWPQDGARKAGLARVIEACLADGCVGLKHALAYTRPVSCGASPDLGSQDSAYADILQLADDFGLPFQMHTGMSVPATNGDPRLLEPLFARYPRVKFILLHTYPFTREAAFLSRNYANVYLDNSWLAMLLPASCCQILAEWLDFVPLHKLMMSTDSVTCEDCLGAYRVIQAAVEWAIDDRIARKLLARDAREGVVEALLGGNARAVFGL